MCPFYAFKQRTHRTSVAVGLALTCYAAKQSPKYSNLDK